MGKPGNLVVAQGGGPTAVVNASLFGITVEAAGKFPASARLLGCRGGIVGLFARDWIDLRAPSAWDWRRIARAPGAALGSCRKRLSEDEAAQAVDIFRREGVRYFFYIGGNDSMDTALKIWRAASDLRYEMFVAGVPKTIDNDLPHTDHCPGFGSAARYFAQSLIDLGTDIRSLPTPVSIIEVLGRNAGWLVASTVLARREPDDAPHLIYVPERPLSVEQFLTDVKRVYDRHGWVVAAVSEGVRDSCGRLWAESGEASKDDFGHSLPGDVAVRMAALVARPFEVVQELGPKTGRAGSLGTTTIFAQERV